MVRFWEARWFYRAFICWWKGHDDCGAFTECVWCGKRWAKWPVVR